MPGTKAGDIIQVMGVGFTIGDRLLRPAQVGVSSGGPAHARGRQEPRGIEGRLTSCLNATGGAVDPRRSVAGDCC